MPKLISLALLILLSFSSIARAQDITTNLRDCNDDDIYTLTKPLLSSDGTATSLLGSLADFLETTTSLVILKRSTTPDIEVIIEWGELARLLKYLWLSEMAHCRQIIDAYLAFNARVTEIELYIVLNIASNVYDAAMETALDDLVN